MPDKPFRAFLLEIALPVIALVTVGGLIFFAASSGKVNYVERRCDRLLDAFRRGDNAEIMEISGKDPAPGQSFVRLADRFDVVSYSREAVAAEDDSATAVVNVTLRPKEAPAHGVITKEEHLRMTVDFRLVDGEWYLSSEARLEKKP